MSTQPYLMSDVTDVIVTTKGKRVLEFLCSKTLIFQIPYYFKLCVFEINLFLAHAFMFMLEFEWILQKYMYGRNCPSFPKKKNEL